MRKHHSAEGKIRIVLEGLRGEESIANIGKLGSETFTFSVPFPTPFILPIYLIILGYWGSTGIYPIRRPIPAPPLAAMHPHAGLGTRHGFLLRDGNRERDTPFGMPPPRRKAPPCDLPARGAYPPNHWQAGASDRA